jgi:DNA-binding response OmpR family regulator
MRPQRLHKDSAEQRIDIPLAIAVVAEDLDLGRRFAKALVHPDFRFVVVPPDEMAKFASGSTTFDLVLLHVGRERAEGTLLQEILRKGEGCIVVLSRKATGVERAAWLEHGADDCLSQPCDGEELRARLRASVRRHLRGGKRAPTLKVGSLVLSPRDRTAEINGRPLSLTTCEFSLLAALAEHPGQVLGREELIEKAKGSADLAFDRSVDVQVSRLRAKLNDDSRQPQFLKTVRGVGYMLVPGNRAARERLH